MATGAQLFHNIRGTIRALLAGNSSLALAFGKKDASGNLILPSGHLLLTNGTGTGQVNTLFTYSGTTASSATTQLTLNNGSLTDLGGAPITLTKLKFISGTVVGHTDSTGSDAYNQKLSVRRSEAIKTYLVGKGIEKNRVYTEGKGEKQPVADNKTAEGRAKNRRVEIEVVGTRAN